MGFFDNIFGNKKKNKQEEKRGINNANQKYINTGKIIARIDQAVGKDLSGRSYEKEMNEIMSLSPDSIKFIFDIWSKNIRATEDTDALLVKVLGRIAKEKSGEEKLLAIRVLQKTLDLPDDNTTRPMRRRNACIKTLDELKALPGVDYSQAEETIDNKPFRLEPIDISQIGPIQPNSPQEKPNFESSALWQLILYPQQQYEEVIRKFEANYARWSKTFDRRSLSLVLCAYGCALEKLDRNCEALIAHRWACKIYPFRGFSSCDLLSKLEVKVAKEIEKKEQIER